jgi:cell wall-associated NlpC family hydrolase
MLQVVMQSNIKSEQVKMIVKVSVADLRSKPVPVPSSCVQGPALSKNIGDQDSQVLFGDSIWAEELPDNSDWYKVSVVGQKAWRNNGWVAYPGFILKSRLMPVSEFPQYNIVLRDFWAPLFSEMNDTSKKVMDLAFGTKLEAKKANGWWEVFIKGETIGYLKASDGIYELSAEVKEDGDALRAQIVRCAKMFLKAKTPYVWGGCSPVNNDLEKQITGVDCSGLTYLCYEGGIPRDAGPQRRAALELKKGDELKEADLIFFAKDEQGLRISHVILYIGNGKAIECTGRGVDSVAEAQEKGFSIDSLSTGLVDIKEMIGVDVADIESGKTIAKNGYRIFLGTYFTKDKIQAMRDNARGVKFHGW